MLHVSNGLMLFYMFCWLCCLFNS